jgi:hypothetical protein
MLASSNHGPYVSRRSLDDPQSQHGRLQNLQKWFLVSMTVGSQQESHGILKESDLLHIANHVVLVVPRSS